MPDTTAALPPRLTVPRDLAATGLRHSAWWATLTALCAVLLAPLFVVDVPPLVDYPNHLARAFVLESLPHDAVLARFYAAHWAIIPNLAVDLVAPPLMRVLPVHTVGRLLIAAAVLLPVLGTVAYSTALGGRWWCLAVGLVAYNGTLMEGFLNFNLSAGVALLLGAAWLRWRDAHPLATIALSTAGAVVLFTCHLMGLLFFAALLASAESFRLLRDSTAASVVPSPAPRRRSLAPPGQEPPTAGSQPSPKATPQVTLPTAAPLAWVVQRLWPMRMTLLWLAVRRGAILLLIFLAPAVLYWLSPLQALGGDSAFMPPLGKLVQLLAPFTNYSLTLDVITAVAAFACPCLCLLLRRGRIPLPAALAGGFLLLAYAASPYAWKGTFQLDTRFAIMLGFMLFAGFIPQRWPPWLRRTIAVVTVGLFAVRMALLTTAWVQHSADLADLRHVLAPLRPGQAIYVVSVMPTDPAAYWAQVPWPRRLSGVVQTDSHLGALALIEHRAWWPFEFDIPSQQPIQTLEPYRSMAGRTGNLPDQNDLPNANLCGFDDVLLTEADAAPDLPEGRFHLLAHAGFAALYAIESCPPAS